MALIAQAYAWTGSTDRCRTSTKAALGGGAVDARRLARSDFARQHR
jgi:hypothetical protein